jgi:uncharacterized membrane protein YhaH (DUF805 family)
MNFFEAMKSCLVRKYATFKGRARRSEYWWFILFWSILGLTHMLLQSPITALLVLLTFIPLLAVQARRLHDIDKSGWWQLISLIPIFNLVLLYWSIQEGDTYKNLYGPPNV